MLIYAQHKCIQAGDDLQFVPTCLCPKGPVRTNDKCHSCFYRYGKIVSTKAILDKNTNQCKGKHFYSDSPLSCGRNNNLWPVDSHRSRNSEDWLELE